MPSRQHLTRWGGFAMMIAGLCWIIKATVILVADYQPPLIFEIAPLLFALGLLGLYVRIRPPVSRTGTIGMVVVSIAFVARVAATLYEVIPGARISTGEDFVFPYSLFVLVGMLGIFLGLLLLGVAILRTQGLPPPWHVLPLGVGVLAILVFVTGILHIELPILLIGCLWTLLGYAIWWSASCTTTTTAS